MSEDTNKNEILLAEWKEIRESLRSFGNKRFTQLTVFIAATSFMVNALFGQSERTLLISLRIMGIALGILFLVMERRTVKYIRAFAKRGLEVEKELKHPKLNERRPKDEFLSGTKAIYTLYWLVIGFWILSFFLKP
jgi:hypothetical protein